jgi:hypothetical protein
MQKHKIVDSIGIFDDLIPKDFCNQAINLYHNQNKLNKTYDRFVTEAASIDKKKDNCFGCDGSNVEVWEENLKPLFVNLIQAFNFYKKLTGIHKYYGDHFRIDTTKIQKTEPGEGYHIWHIEHSGRMDFIKRILFFIIYLNDDFTAGETEFLHMKQRVNPKQGRIIIAPAHFPYVHRGNPPLQGVKYIHTGWFNIP